MAETIGSITDKITIIQLKIFHMNEQLLRQDASLEHKENVKRKLDVLKIQLKDLSEELTELFSNVISRKTKLKVYRQFKMYNDPVYRINEKK